MMKIDEKNDSDIFEKSSPGKMIHREFGIM
jgi:hypothetical protein